MLLKMLIINAPFAFRGVWSMLKSFLNEKTRDKISVIGSSYQETLLEIIDSDKLPKFLGGTCTCENEGGCMQSDKGPWNDFEIV